MTLTMGRGPLSANPADANYSIAGPEHRLFVEDVQKRVRVQFGDQMIADSLTVKRLHETGLLPVYYFPSTDVRFEFLKPSEHATHCPFKGDARYFSIEAARQRSENAVWNYPKFSQPLAFLSDYFAFYLDRVHAVYEEEERLTGHPHDPYHRVDVQRSSRHVRVTLNGTLLAETTNPLAVFETGLPARFYVPRRDIRFEELRESNTRSVCPYKGTASYWSARQGPADIAWAYEQPLPEGTGLAEHVSFLGEGVIIEVDGKRT